MFRGSVGVGDISQCDSDNQGVNTLTISIRLKDIFVYFLLYVKSDLGKVVNHP